MSRILTIVPARLAATRLPEKPLAMIGNAPMIVHVWRRACEANLGRVVVATDDTRIAEAIRTEGGEAVMTRADHPSGSDRAWEAVAIADLDATCDIIVNLQGDLPTLDPKLVRTVADVLLQTSGETDAPDIATLVTEITDPTERENPNVVKAIGTPVVTTAGDTAQRLRALYFTRATAPTGDGPLYHHIGIYAYRRAALARFVALPPAPLEQRERLEQLRALENGMRIDAAVVDTTPLGVDTPEDLARARAILAPDQRT